MEGRVTYQCTQQFPLGEGSLEIGAIVPTSSDGFAKSENGNFTIFDAYHNPFKPLDHPRYFKRAEEAASFDPKRPVEYRYGDDASMSARILAIINNGNTIVATWGTEEEAFNFDAKGFRVDSLRERLVNIPESQPTKEKRRRPHGGDFYYYLDSELNIVERVYVSGFKDDEARISIGNAFLYYGYAQAAIPHVKAAYLGKRAPLKMD